MSGMSDPTSAQERINQIKNTIYHLPSDILWLLERLQKVEEILLNVREHERLSDFSDEMIDTFLNGK